MSDENHRAPTQRNPEAGSPPANTDNGAALLPQGLVPNSGLWMKTLSALRNASSREIFFKWEGKQKMKGGWRDRGKGDF